MQTHYSHAHVSHPTSVDLYKLSNHSHINLIHESILIYIFAGLVGLCLGIKCVHGFLRICCNVRETNDILTTDGDEVSESYEAEEDYEPPEQLQTAAEATITYIQDNSAVINKNNKTGIIEPIVERNEEDSENSEDLPSYYEICVKSDK